MVVARAWQDRAGEHPAESKDVAIRQNGAPDTRMTNLGNAVSDLDLADTEIAANITFQIGNATRMDCADPSTNLQPGNAPCFDPPCVRSRRSFARLGRRTLFQASNAPCDRLSGAKGTGRRFELLKRLGRSIEEVRPQRDSNLYLDRTVSPICRTQSRG